MWIMWPSLALYQDQGIALQIGAIANIFSAVKNLQYAVFTLWSSWSSHVDPV